MILQGKLPELTPIEVYYHCIEHGRNAELEKIIINDPESTYYYALYVIKGRWTEAENTISTNSEWAYYYALNVIEGKLPELMHNAMLIHADDHAKQYLNFINNLTPTVP